MFSAGAFNQDKLQQYVQVEKVGLVVTGKGRARYPTSDPHVASYGPGFHLTSAEKLHFLLFSGRGPVICRKS